jgi:hypothetical protein
VGKRCEIEKEALQRLACMRITDSPRGDLSSHAVLPHHPFSGHILAFAHEPIASLSTSSPHQKRSIMADHSEEQEMESEALTAIFDTAFEILQENPFQWSVSIYPEAGDPVELDALNHVACKLLATLPVDYPEGLPELHVEIIKGLAPDHQETLTQMAMEEAVANEGVACIFAVAERIREWLAENNVKGLDDISMYAQMMRKQKDEEKANVRNVLHVLLYTILLVSIWYRVSSIIARCLYLNDVMLLCRLLSPSCHFVRRTFLLLLFLFLLFCTPRLPSKI